MAAQPLIKDLAIIGDRRTCAMVDKAGCINWYCPSRFDQPAIFSLLIDQDGGCWEFNYPGKKFLTRSYKKYAPILTSRYTDAGNTVTVTDWMPAGNKLDGICRKFSEVSKPMMHTINCRPDYGAVGPHAEPVSPHTFKISNGNFYLHSSHPLHFNNEIISCSIPAGEVSWLFLSGSHIHDISLADLDKSLTDTIEYWEKIVASISYEGVYQNEFYQSYVAIQLMTHTSSGGIIAAATTSLPEVPGGSRNYDYRFIWLRDTAMNVSALIRSGSKGGEAEKFLSFLCDTRTKKDAEHFIPMYNIDGDKAPPTRELQASGYLNSKPVVVGNDANEQLQLDANGNVLLAAKQVYELNHDKPNWDTVQTIADYLASNWNQKDHGIWEENTREHFTSSKVIVARSLEFIADYADTQEQKNTWLQAARNIRMFISEKCMTNDGAYAVFAGSQEVDITAALFAVWLFDEPLSEAMQRTIERIEQDLKNHNLYHRNLLEFDEKKEGVFLAGSLWVAQHFVMLGNLEKAKSIIDACLHLSTDLGFLAEEGNMENGEMLGNFPQTFVHASLMGVILDYNKALQEQQVTEASPA